MKAKEVRGTMTPPTMAGRAHLLIVDENLTNRLRGKGILTWNPFESVREIDNYLVLATIDCIFLESTLSTQALAEKLRQVFANVLFVVIPLNEVDGVLPENAWAFIEAARSRPR